MLTRKFFTFIFLLLLIPGVVWAADSSLRTISLGKDKTHEGDFIGAGTMVDLSGAIKGDAMVAGGEVDIDGPISADALLVGGNVFLASPVGGSSRLVGGTVEISGETGRNLTAAGGTVRVDKNAKVGGNAYIAGGNVNIRGLVSGNLMVAAGTVVISGTVGRNVTIVADEISLADGAVINGSLTYYSQHEATIASGAKIVGPVEHKAVAQPTKTSAAAASFIAGYFIWKALSYVLVGFVVWKLCPSILDALLGDFQADPWRKVGTGLVAAIIIPIASLIVMITLIGLPLGLIALALYAVTAYLAMLAGILLFGRLLGHYLGLTHTPGRFPLLVYSIGIVTLTIIGVVPLFGALIAFIVWLWGFGTVMRMMMNRLAPQQSPPA